MYQKLKENSGFSLVELLVVIAIIGVLAAVAAVSYNGARLESRDAKRKADIGEIFKALNIYHTSTEDYPPDCSDAGYTGGCDVVDDPVIGISSDSSLDGIFMDFMAPEYMESTYKDPYNDTQYHYTYSTFVEYPPGSGVIYSFLVTAKLEDAANNDGGIGSVTGYENLYALGNRL